jgi:3-methyladenine DNA glycosylase/8-oxoguanine DNA glycosylase
MGKDQEKMIGFTSCENNCTDKGKPHEWAGALACSICGMTYQGEAMRLYMEMAYRFEKQKEMLETVIKQRDHFKAELDADVEHILELAIKLDELKKKNEQLRHDLEVTLDQPNMIHGR